MLVVHGLDRVLFPVDQAKIFHGWLRMWTSSQMWPSGSSKACWYMKPWSCASRTVLPPFALALATSPSTSSLLAHERHTRTSVVFFASATGLLVKVLQNGSQGHM